MHSLAEVQEAANNHTEALVNYKKSLAPDPQNKHAANRIEALAVK